MKSIYKTHENINWIIKKKKFLKIQIASKVIKYLGINLTKEVKDIYINKILTSYTEEDTNKSKDILHSCIETIDIAKMLIQPKATYMQALTRFQYHFPEIE